MFITSSRLLIATVLAAAIALVGCAQPIAEAPAVQVTAPVALEVHKQTESHMLQLGPDGQASTLERDRLDAFIADLVGGRPDALHVTVSGTRADAQLQAVAGILIEDGVDPKKIVIVPTGERALATGPVTIAVDLYTATAPACARWSTIISAASDNSAARPDLGCFDLKNLGAMIADPHDLVQGSTTPYADGTTSAEAVQRYHQDNVKPLPPFSGFAGSTGNGSGAGASNANGGT